MVTTSYDTPLNPVLENIFCWNLWRNSDKRRVLLLLFFVFFLAFLLVSFLVPFHVFTFAIAAKTTVENTINYLHITWQCMNFLDLTSREFMQLVNVVFLLNNCANESYMHKHIRMHVLSCLKRMFEQCAW